MVWICPSTVTLTPTMTVSIHDRRKCECTMMRLLYIRLSRVTPHALLDNCFRSTGFGIFVFQHLGNCFVMAALFVLKIYGFASHFKLLASGVQPVKVLIAVCHDMSQKLRLACITNKYVLIGFAYVCCKPCLLCSVSGCVSILAGG